MEVIWSSENWRTLVPGDPVAIDGKAGVVIELLSNSKARPASSAGETVMRVRVRLTTGRELICEYLFGSPFKTIQEANPLDVLSEI